jgi:DNA-binding MarR family transcriptional regulator
VQSDATDADPSVPHGPAAPRDLSEFRDLDEEVTRAVARLYRRFRAERAAGELGDAAMAALAHLHRHGPTTLGSLSDYERVTPASMSQSVNRLAELGLVVRSRDPEDGRRVLFELTDAGRDRAQASREQRHAWFRERLAERTAQERQALRTAALVLGEIADA